MQEKAGAALLAKAGDGADCTQFAVTIKKKNIIRKGNLS
jgi:hypothetical protein